MKYYILGMRPSFKRVHKICKRLLNVYTQCGAADLLWSPYVIGQTIIFLPCGFYETGNRNRILEMSKFCIWFRLRVTSTVLYRFSPNFACGSEIWSFHRLLSVIQTGSSLPTLEVCGFRFRRFSGSGDQIFQQFSIKSHIQIKFSNADFVFNGD